jgi:hypothetical protein
MRDPMHECVRNFGPVPRDFTFWDRMTYLHVPRPQWLRSDPSDALMVLYRNLGKLFREGVVVWGYVIQANQLLFEHGRMNCPGEVVYSLEDRSRASLEYLEDVARELYTLKGSRPARPELIPIAEYLTDELVRVFGLRVPSVVSPAIECRISTTFFVRKHLPTRRLCAPWLPLVVSPVRPHVVMPLPERHWPDELFDAWTQ